MLIINGAGRIGRDAETRQTSGGSVTSFSVACDGYNGEKVTTWIDCSLWGKRGESLARHLTKGSQVAFSGRGLLELYQKKDGTKGAKLSCNVSEIALQGGRSDSGPSGDTGSARPQSSEGDGGSFSDDEIPF